MRLRSVIERLQTVDLPNAITFDKNSIFALGEGDDGIKKTSILIF